MARTYCGAKNRSGTPCQRPAGWGTKHPGTGRCKLHGGSSTGARTQEGRERISQANRRSGGLYSDVLTSDDRRYYDDAASFTPGELVASNLWLLQGRIKKLIAEDGLSGNRSHTQQSRKILDLANLLLQEGELTPDFVSELKLRLQNFDVQQMANVLNGAAHQATVLTQLDRLGQVHKQLQICQVLIVNILRGGADFDTKKMVLGTIQELKLAAGLPMEEIDQMLAAAKEPLGEEFDDPIEGELINEPVHTNRTGMDNQASDPWA